jgi:Group 4 capsule polysaccharide lipoprotein gfcB, YjbF
MANLPNISTTSQTHKGSTRKGGALAACLAMLALAGCSSEQSDMGLLYGAARDAFSGDGAGSVTLKQAGAVPYASLGVRVDGGPEVLIVLATDAPHSRLWTAAKAIALQTDNGRIVRTAGLAHNLSGVSGDLGAMVSPIDALRRREGTRTLLYDFADLHAYSVKTVCNVASRGRENVQILGKAIPTERVEERCRADALNWSFANIFWLGEKSGMVWQSIQYVHPRLGPISTEILRPPETP